MALAEKKKKIGNATMESYVHFWQDANTANLTIHQLNQIITMHGFKKLHKRPKKDVIEALSSIDLLLPFRSTLKETVSSFASLPLDQVVTDICALQWNECSVQSVETVGSLHDEICNLQEEEEEEVVIGSNKKKKVTTAKWSLKKKRSSRRIMPRVRHLEKLDALALAAFVAASGGGGSGSSAAAPTASSRASGSDGSC